MIVAQDGTEFDPGIPGHPGESRQFTFAGEKLKNVPRGYGKNHPMAEYLKHKSWYVEHPLADIRLQIASPKVLTAVFHSLHPLNNWLNPPWQAFKCSGGLNRPKSKNEKTVSL